MVEKRGNKTIGEIITFNLILPSAIILFIALMIFYYNSANVLKWEHRELINKNIVVSAEVTKIIEFNLDDPGSDLVYTPYYEYIDENGIIYSGNAGFKGNNLTIFYYKNDAEQYLGKKVEIYIDPSSGNSMLCNEAEPTGIPMLVLAIVGIVGAAAYVVFLLYWWGVIKKKKKSNDDIETTKKTETEG